MLSLSRFFGWQLPRFAMLLAMILALWGLAERWTGPELPFRLHDLKVIAREAATEESLLPLATGDRLISINGRFLKRDAPSVALLASAAREGPVRVEFRHEGSLRVETLSFAPTAPARRLGLALRSMAALLIFSIGLWVSLRRRDSLSRVFLFLTLLFGLNFALLPRVSQPFAGALLEIVSDLAELYLAPVFLHFLIHFPEKRPRTWRLKLLIYGSTTILALPVVAAILLDRNLDTQLRALNRIIAVNAGLLFLACFVVLAVKAFRPKHRRERYRIRRVLLAALLGIGPLAVLMLLHQLMPGRHLVQADWVLIFLAFLPLSFAFGILGPELGTLQRRASILRRFSTVGLAMALIFLAVRLLLFAAWGRSGRFADDVFSELIALMVVVFFLPILLKRTRPQQGEGEAEPLRDSLRWLAPPRYFTSRLELQQTFLPRLGADCGAGWLLWLERDGSEAWKAGERWRHERGPLPSKALPEPGARIILPQGLEASLLGERRFLAAEQWDPYWAESLMGPQALPFCRRHDWCLISALATEGDSPALLVMGPAWEEPLYPPAMVESLGKLNATLDLHLRNLALLDRATREEQLRRELDLARHIQLRLLPEQTPRFAGVELAGRIRTSSEVGGDYYDFLTLPGERLGLALGDATGHGVPAALLISSVALAFHTQATGGEMPDRVLSGMNQALCSFTTERGGSGLLAGFVYALFERSGSILHYCNGGMPAPWILRAGGGIERLDRGGLLLGMSPAGEYQRGLLKLHPGDLLFLRSDGLEDQVDEEGRVYGEARLMSWLRNSRSGGLEDLADRLIEELLAFAKGRQEDDISFIIMRLIA